MHFPPIHSSEHQTVNSIEALEFFLCSKCACFKGGYIQINGTEGAAAAMIQCYLDIVGGP